MLRTYWTVSLGTSVNKPQADVLEAARWHHAHGVAPLDNSQVGNEEEEAPVSTEEKNKALVCRFFEEVFKRGNLGVADELLAADFAWKLPGKDAGIEDYKQWVAKQLAASSDLHFSIEEQIAESEKVVTRLIGSGSQDQQQFGEFALSGVRITIEAIIIPRVVEGKIVEERNKADFSPLLATARRTREERARARRAGDKGGPNHPAGLAPQGGAHPRGLGDHSRLPAC
jgi:predicted ester cyclase